MTDSNISSQHPTNLVELVQGTLTDEQAAPILLHVANCDICAKKVEALWQDTPLAQQLPAIDAAPPAQPQLQVKLSQKINRTDLGGNMVRFFSTGFFQVIMTLMKPFLSPPKSNLSSRSKQNPPTGTPDV